MEYKEKELHWNDLFRASPLVGQYLSPRVWHKLCYVKLQASRLQTSGLRTRDAESGPGQPALANPALIRGLGVDGLQRSLPTLAFCLNSPLPPNLNLRLPSLYSQPYCLLTAASSGDGSHNCPLPGTCQHRVASLCALHNLHTVWSVLANSIWREGSVVKRLCFHCPEQWAFCSKMVGLNGLFCLWGRSVLPGVSGVQAR